MSGCYVLSMLLLARAVIFRQISKLILIANIVFWNILGYMLLNVLPIYHSIPVEIGTKTQTFHYSKSVLLKNAMS